MDIQVLTPSGLKTAAGDADGKLLVGGITLDSAAGLEIKNDVGNPVPVSGKVGYSLKRVSANITRPSDTTAYAIGDAITNSTTAPSVFELDLSAFCIAGQSIEVRKLVVVSSIKQSTLPLINVFLSSTTFTATNDNSALSIDDTTMEAGGSWFNCDLQNYTSVNSRVAYTGNHQPLVLAAADTKLYGTLQAANAYPPGNAEKFTIIAWIAPL